MRGDIVIVGGGFAGFWAAIAARRAASEQIAVTLVSRDPLLQIRPRLYEAHPETLAVNIEPLLATVGVHFIKGEATGLDLAEQDVVLASAHRLHYDRLVVATGSRMQRPPVPGADTAYGIDTQAEAVALDRRLREIAQNQQTPRIVIVGAGFTGIELALEMRDRLALHGNAAVGERASILLLDRADVVGAELGAGPRAEIEAALDEARVERRLAVTVTALAPDRVEFADGSAIDADAVVITTGMIAAPYVALLPGQRDALGRLIVEPSLRAPAANAVFVAGDSAHADVGDGHVALQSCQHALQTGRFAGENAARDLAGLPLLSYAQPRYVTCLDLGRHGAVLTQGWDRQVSLTGPQAKALKQRINQQLIYPPVDATRESLLAMSSTVMAEQGRPD